MTTRLVRPLVGRTAELAELAEVLAGVAGGHGAVVFLEGEAGIGKTRLADETAARALARGMRVLRARCWEGEGAPAFHPWVRALQEAGGAEAGASPFANGGGEPTGLPPLDGGPARFRLFEDVVAWLRRVGAAGGAVVVLEDLHWADVPSLDLLRAVVRDLRDVSVLVLGTARPTADDATRGPLLADAAREGRRLTLPGLDRDAVRRFVEDARGPTSAAAIGRLHERSGGNPFFLGELLALLPDEHDPLVDDLPLPAGVRSVIERRLLALDPDDRRVLAVASVMHRPFDVTTLSAMAGVEAATALARATKLGVLRQDGRRYDVAHALVRQTLYESLPTDERERLHAVAGRALEATCVAAPDGDVVSEIAYHYGRAVRHVPADDAVNWLERAGNACRAQLGFEQAADAYRRALHLLLHVAADAPTTAERRCRLLLLLGDVEARAGARARAVAWHLEAADVARAAALPEHFARAVLGYCGRMEVAVRPDARMLRLLEEARAMLPERALALRARITCRLAATVLFTEAAERAAPLSAEGIALAEASADAATLAGALTTHRLVVWGTAPATARLALVERLIDAARRAQRPEEELAGLVWRIVDLLELGDVVGAERSLVAYERIAEDLRQPFYLWHVPSVRAMQATMEGRLTEAERWTGEAIALGQRVDAPTAPLRAAVLLYALRDAQGRLDELTAPLEAAVDRLPTLAVLRAGLALVHARAQRWREARNHLDVLVASGLARIPNDGQRVTTLVRLAEVAAELGDSTQADELYALLLPLSGTAVVVSFGYACDGAIDRYLGMLAATMRRWEDAERHFREALALNERMAARVAAAHTRREHAAMLRQRGHPKDTSHADVLAAKAAASYRAMGLAWWAERTRPAAPNGRAEPAEPNAFTLTGSIWTIVYDGVRIQLADAKGMRYLATLLREPGREHHVLDLAGAADVRERADEPPLDAEARAAYRARLVEARSELDGANEDHDLAARARLRDEIDALTRELGDAYGIGAPSRRNGLERVRKAVTNRIRDRLRVIEQRHPSLGRHLANAVRTGTVCVYRPERPTSWET